MPLTALPAAAALGGDKSCILVCTADWACTNQKPEFNLVLTARFIEDVRYWAVTDAKMAGKLVELEDTVRHDPFTGIGKPEPLKGLGAGVCPGGSILNTACFTR